jgi:DNA-binding PadR family transcriptional regulator
MSPLQVAILQIVESNDGRLNWYQLDRALTQRVGGLDPGAVSSGLLPALHELEEGGLIASNPGPNPGQPVYSMTPAGQQVLLRCATTETPLAH